MNQRSNTMEVRFGKTDGGACRVTIDGAYAGHLYRESCVQPPEWWACETLDHVVEGMAWGRTLQDAKDAVRERAHRCNPVAVHQRLTAAAYSVRCGCARDAIEARIEPNGERAAIHVVCPPMMVRADNLGGRWAIGGRDACRVARAGIETAVFAAIHAAAHGE